MGDHRRIAVILNVRSGPQRHNAHTAVVETLLDHSVSAQIFPAATGAAVRGLAERAVDEGYAILVAAGGDGTISAVASVAMATGRTLGVLPMGTFNHFARDMGIPTDLAAAVETLKSTRTAWIDIASVNGRTFINTSSIGVYPRLVIEREQYRRSGLARVLAIITAAIRTIREFRPLYLKLQIPDRAWRGFTPFVFIGNNPYSLEGSDIGSRERLDTGNLWVCTTFEPSLWGLVKLGIEAWLGRAARNPNFGAVTTTRLAIDSRRRRLLVALDGEVERLETPLNYVIHPRALEIIVP